jgi:hypothetical protein
VGPKADLDTVEKRKFLTPPGFEIRPLGSPAHSQSLYQLRYTGSHMEIKPGKFYTLVLESKKSLLKGRRTSLAGDRTQIIQSCLSYFSDLST